VATFTLRLVKEKPFCQPQRVGLFRLNLSPEPNTKFKYPLKLLRLKKPSVLIADRMRGQVIIGLVRTTLSMGQDMVGGPVSLYFPSTDVASASSLVHNGLAFRRCQGLTLVSLRANYQLSPSPFFA
jgi:Mor family transcriptional regulator